MVMSYSQSKSTAKQLIHEQITPSLSCNLSLHLRFTPLQHAPVVSLLPLNRQLDRSSGTVRQSAC